MITGKRKCSKRITKGEEGFFFPLFFKSSSLSSSINLYGLNAKCSFGDTSPTLPLYTLFHCCVSRDQFIFLIRIMSNKTLSAKQSWLLLLLCRLPWAFPLKEQSVVSPLPFIVLHNPNYNDKPISKPCVSGSKIAMKCGLSSTEEFEIWKKLQRPPTSALYPLKTYCNPAIKHAQIWIQSVHQ